MSGTNLKRTQSRAYATMVASACSALVLLSSCSLLGGSATEEPMPDLSPFPAKRFWSQAEAIALQWRSDAYPKEVIVSVELPNSEVSSSVVTFLFESPSEDLARYRVTCDETGCMPYEIEHVPGSLFLCKPIAMNDFDLESAEVLEMALQEGGAKYVNRETATIDMFLGYGTGACKDRLTWRVLFKELLPGPSDSFQITFDANTGEVLRRLPQ